ncbi:MAG: RNA polymerase sigma-54 factor, partial [Calditrichaeota bacterium]|nr:RNA polymerase sigma-54 factor [Calditrichota bacterium]
MLELSQRIGLEQKLSPQQILLSTLLQIPALNMEMRIQQEMEMNPILELDITEDEEIDIDQKQEEEEKETDAEELSEQLENEEEIDWDKLQTDDDSYEIKLPRDQNNEEIERQDAVEITIQEKLIDQLYELKLDENERQVAEYIIWNLRDDGYLDEHLTLETIAHIYDSTVPVVESILQKIQRLEPKGMGSRNLRE